MNLGHEQSDERITSYTPALWAILSEDDRYAEYLRVRSELVHLRSEIEQVATEMGNKDNAGWRMLREWSQRLSALARGGD